MSDLIPPVLIAMPDNVMRDILDKCDYVSIQCLRKTCHDLRNFIDDNKPKLLMSQIEINHYPKAIELNFKPYYCQQYPAGEGVYLTYQKLRGKRHKIIWERSDGTREKIIKNETFVDSFIRDFGSLLAFKLPILKQFSVWNKGDGLSKIRRAFESSGNTPIKVHLLLIMETKSAENILDVLQYMCPDTIHTLAVEHYRCMGHIWDFRKLVQLEQWKNLKELDMNMTPLRGAVIQDYHHFESAEVCFDNLTMDDIIKAKENFLNSPSTTKSLKVAAEESFPDRDQFKDTLGQPYERPEDDEEYIRYTVGMLYWFFRRSDNNVVRVREGRHSAYFDIISSKNVPKTARVAD